MGASIRWLKTQISTLSPELSDEQAKSALTDKIDSFIHEKFSAADAAIVEIALSRYFSDVPELEGRIPGAYPVSDPSPFDEDYATNTLDNPQQSNKQDVIVTFAKSHIVESILLAAKTANKNFRVIVVDSRPHLEGRALLESLILAGIECQYVHLYALDYVMVEATKVFLGAQSVMVDGSLCSRAGTTSVAMAAKEYGIPVVVMCESVKFSERVNVSGIVENELGE